MFTVDAIVRVTGGRLLSGSPAQRVGGVSTDSRMVQRGELFVALTGPNFDGHAFVREACAKGAVGAIVRRAWAERHRRSFRQHALIAVRDPLVALQALARWHWARWRPLTIGVTGSAGKTTTKELIAAVLGQTWPVVKAQRSWNNQIGLSLTLLRGRAPQEIAVMEYGANHPGEIAHLCTIAAPHLAVITNIGQAHLEFFHTLHGALKAKWELIAALPRQGVAVLNHDDPFLRRAEPRARVRVVTFGVRAACQVRGSAIAAIAGGVAFTALKRRWRLPLVGRHNVMNALAALAVARELGVPHETVQRAFDQVQPMPGRFQLMQVDGIQWIDDSYNANPVSVRQAIETLTAVGNGHRRIAVLGDMLELGKSSSRWHRTIGRMVAEAGVNRLITVGREAKHIAQAAQRVGLGARAQHCASVEEARQLVSAWVQSGDVVLVKGSHAMGLRELIPCSTTSSTR